MRLTGPDYSIGLCHGQNNASGNHFNGMGIPLWGRSHGGSRKRARLVLMGHRIGYVILILSPFIAFAYFLR